MLTDEEIDRLDGRELDAAVDRVVCDGKYFISVDGDCATRFVSESESKGSNPWNWKQSVPHYSTSNGDAVGLLLGREFDVEASGENGETLKVVIYWSDHSKFGFSEVVGSVSQFATLVSRCFVKAKSRESAAIPQAT